jgi:hypothetical protein
VIITAAVSNEDAVKRFGAYETVLPYLRKTSSRRADRAKIFSRGNSLPGPALKPAFFFELTLNQSVDNYRVDR